MQGRCKTASALLSQKVCLRLDGGEFMITIKDNIIKLDFHEETLHCDIYADGACVEVDFSKGTYKITVNG